MMSYFTIKSKIVLLFLELQPRHPQTVSSNRIVFPVFSDVQIFAWIKIKVLVNLLNNMYYYKNIWQEEINYRIKISITTPSTKKLTKHKTNMRAIAAHRHAFLFSSTQNQQMALNAKHKIKFHTQYCASFYR